MELLNLDSIADMLFFSEKQGISQLGSISNLEEAITKVGYNALDF